jgi:hypothetical protein
MESRIKEILIKIEKLNQSLKKEQLRLAEKYGYHIRKGRVFFLESIKRKNRRFRIPTWKYVIPRKIKHLASLPFIYSMLVPALVLDIFITIYQFATFPLYGIPKIKRSDYFIYDRRFLDYLNVIQKIHCMYCSYVNGLFSYALEIGARTERYWCPIKSASKTGTYHQWYKDYADYGDPEQWSCKFNDNKVFIKNKK